MTTTEELTYASPLDDRQRAIITQWVKDLRSGDYLQVRGRLEGNYAESAFEDPTDEQLAETEGLTGFCCLGVLVRQPAALEDTGYEIDTRFECTTLRPIYGGTPWETSLPEEVQEALGLTERVPSVQEFDDEPRPLQSNLIDLNDDFGWTFPKIADLVEAFLLNGEAWEPAFARISGQ